MGSETLEVDVLIVGAGPAGLAAALRLGQLTKQHHLPLSVMVLEKAAQVGDHILSGCVFEPKALYELLPQWQSLNAPLNTPVTQDKFCLLTKQHALSLPVPSFLNNHGNYLISLGQLCHWLADQAQALDIEIYCGFAANTAIIDSQQGLVGILTKEVGRDRQGVPKAQYQAGMKILAKQTILAEGCRGSLSEQVIQHFGLRQQVQPQTYALGLKELWEVPDTYHQEGLVFHSVGWPLDQDTYGGGFLYHLKDRRVYCGFVVGLDYQNPTLDPYREFQRFKTHPTISKVLKQGRCLAYGARALNEGGLQAIPQLHFPGGVLAGCAAGFLNVPKIKGSHTAMKSGMLAAEAVFSVLQGTQQQADYFPAFQSSWLWSELHQVRNVRPAFRFGLLPGLAYAAIDHYLLKGRAPWTFSHQADHLGLKPLSQVKPIIYPKADGLLTFDKLSSVARSNTYHEENQPCHLQLQNPALAIEHNWKVYGSPEQYYCPAGVYEIVNSNGTPRLQINAQNCLHCKTCDIKDPLQNIRWTPPEGGGGPSYGGL